MKLKKQNKIILAVAIGVVIVLIALILFKIFIFNIKPLPEYKNNGDKAISQSLICAKINNQELKNYCLNNIKKNLNFLEEKRHIAISESNFNEFPCCYSKTYKDTDPTKEEFKQAILKNEVSFCNKIIIPNHKLYCKSLLENPYYCKRISSIYSRAFHEVGKDECFQEAAIKWKDHSLCDNTKNKDFCLLRFTLIQK